jgi:phosphopantetheinyl transferase
MKFLLVFSTALMLIGYPVQIASSTQAASSKSLPVPTETKSESTQQSDYAKALDQWRSHRILRGEIANTKDYDAGFLKGYTGPPGLVDGSADFNLGHSDGMLAKTGKLPNQPDTSDGK